MKYGTPKQSSDGRYYLKVVSENNDGKNVRIQLNNVTLEKIEESQYTLSMTTKAQEQIKHIDNQNILAAKANCSSWFGKDLSEKVLTAAYVTTLMDASMTITKATVNSQVVTREFDCKNQLMVLQDETSVKCDIILDFSGIWFSKKTFGPIWKAVQVRLKSEPVKKYSDESLFNNDEEDGEEEDDDDENDFF